MESVPELSLSPKQKASKSGKLNLRKSLAWDNAFFTSEGVLNDEELAMVNSTFRKSELLSLAPIQEELSKSTESACTLASDNLELDTLEVDVFADLRASIQNSIVKRHQASNLRLPNTSEEQEEHNASCIGPPKKVAISSQNKMKPPISTTRHAVLKPRLKDAKDAQIHGKMDAGGLGDSTSSLRPPRTACRITALPAMLGKKPSSSGSIQTKNDAIKSISETALPPMIGKKPSSSGSLQTKNSTFKSGSAHVVSRPSAGASSRSGESHSAISKLVPPQKYNTGSSVSTSLNLSKKFPLDVSRKKVATTITPSESTTKSLLRTSKSKIGPNHSDNMSMAKQSSRASPRNSIDTTVSDSSSSNSVAILNHSYSSESLDSLSSSTSSLPPQPSDSCELSTDQPRYRTGNPATLPCGQPSNGDRPRSLLNNSTAGNCLRPSGLRMPTPKIGYFDAEKTLVRSSRKFSPHGLQNNPPKNNTGISSTSGGNKPRPSILTSVKPAAPSVIKNSESPLTGAMPISSNHEAIPKSAPKLHPLSKPVELSQAPMVEMDHGMTIVNKHVSSINIEDGKKSTFSDGANSSRSSKTESSSDLRSSQKESSICLDDTVGLLELASQKVSSNFLSEEKTYAAGDSELSSNTTLPVMNHISDAENSLVHISTKFSSLGLQNNLPEIKPGTSNASGGNKLKPSMLNSASSAAQGINAISDSQSTQATPASPLKMHPQPNPTELCQTPRVATDCEMSSSVTKDLATISREDCKEFSGGRNSGSLCKTESGSEVQVIQEEKSICSDDTVGLVKLVSQQVSIISLCGEKTRLDEDSELSAHTSVPILNYAENSQVRSSTKSSLPGLPNNLAEVKPGISNASGGNKLKPSMINSASSAAQNQISDSDSQSTVATPSSPLKMHLQPKSAELCQTPRVAKDHIMSSSVTKDLATIITDDGKESAFSGGGNSGGSCKTYSDSEIRVDHKENSICSYGALSLVDPASQMVSSLSLSEEKSYAAEESELSALSGGGNSDCSCKTESGSEIQEAQKENLICWDDSVGLVETVSQKLSSLYLSEEKSCDGEDLERSAQISVASILNLPKSEMLLASPKTMDLEPNARTPGISNASGGNKLKPSMINSAGSAAQNQISDSDSQSTLATPSSPLKMHLQPKSAELCQTPRVAKDHIMSSSVTKDLATIITEDGNESAFSGGGNSGGSCKTYSGSEIRVAQKENSICSYGALSLVDPASQKVSSLSLSEERAYAAEESELSALSGGGNSDCSCKTESGSEIQEVQKENLICWDDSVGLVDIVSQKLSSLYLSEEKSCDGEGLERSTQISVASIMNSPKSEMLLASPKTMDLEPNARTPLADNSH